ncbi:Aste57867_10498 [Aphanomyces stellatus]|uniref:Aste57867_10498 protein n=1 Tax=Aphanomyces stellatus TaxID=120398 RepID=A0A485KR14_9STRA|nr:hypothetical protein As57867_010458 [Aphanomyces stellatus]VFT87371.1 Aste57867_10498 [Aphanomyces stellatus]
MERYPVLKRMAEAIYGEVLLCRDAFTNDLVAVKKIHMDRATARRTLAPIAALPPSSSHAAAPQYVHENVLQELAMNQRIRLAGGHLYVCRLRSEFYFDEGGEPMLAMVFDFCPHGELLTALSSAKRFSEPQALRYLAQIAQSIDFLHMQHIAHRDISLENILLDAHHHVQLCDFGLACDSHGLTNDPVGKLLYMAPEVLAGHHYHAKQADLWSLGVALFTMVVGHYPFHEASMYDPFYMAHARVGVACLVRKHNVSHLSVEMLALIGQLLAVDPVKRLTIRQVLTHPLLQPYMKMDEDTTSYSTISLEDEAATDATSLYGHHHHPTSLPVSPPGKKTKRHGAVAMRGLQSATSSMSTMSIRSPEVVSTSSSGDLFVGHVHDAPVSSSFLPPQTTTTTRPKVSFKSYFKQKLTHLRRKWSKV